MSLKERCSHFDWGAYILVFPRTAENIPPFSICQNLLLKRLFAFFFHLNFFTWNFYFLFFLSSFSLMFPFFLIIKKKYFSQLTSLSYIIILLTVHCIRRMINIYNLTPFKCGTVPWEVRCSFNTIEVEVLLILEL